MDASEQTAAFDPDVPVPTPTPLLRALVERSPSDRIQRIEFHRTPMWLKRSDRERFPIWQRPLRRWASRRSPWLPAAEAPAMRLQREARRLVALRAAGIDVPQVVAATSDWFVMEDCGPTARDVMRTLEAAGRATLLGEMAADLASLHRRGYWHGGAEIKNTTLAHGRRYRIDFETGFPPEVALADLQARDLFLFLMSCSDYGDLKALLSRYLDEGGPSIAITRAVAAVRPFRRPWQDWVPGRDARRGRAAADSLIAFS